MRPCIAFLFLFALMNVSPVSAKDPVPAEVARFLASRKLVSIVYFQQGSSALTNLAKQSIDSAVPRLSLLDLKKVVVRLEGFAPLEGSEEFTVPLSMSRALAVINYMKEKYNLNTGSFLIGCGDNDLNGVTEDKRRRVEIAFYDNLWDIEDAPVKELILNW